MNYESTIKTGLQPALDPIAGEGEFGAHGTGRGRMIIVGAVIALALGLAWFFMHRAPAATDEASARNAQAQSVSVVTPGRTSVTGTITASGTIAARREMPVGIAGEGGQVVSVLVDAGDWVRAGQVLAVVDRSVQVQQIAGQAANIEVQRANARIAQANLDRALKLVERGFISKADVDRLIATRDAAAGQVRVAAAQLEQLRASSARLNIVAPAAGLVLTRGVEPGQIVSPGSGVLFRIAKEGQLEMQARLAENDLARLTVGQSADVTPVGTSKPFTGQIWQLSPTIDAQTREGVARIALAYDPALRPGGFASTQIRSGAVTAPILPESAILSDQQGTFVYVVGDRNKVSRRAVKTGDVTAQGIVVMDGLSGTEKVVMRAGGFLNPGDVVRPVTAAPTPPAARRGA
ncbi:efflux RND transporter periplasmic adaptor subunit [Novosphingobium sp. PASSN1]|uniref:efflux RND transporter periplasmic adaptor subunit n=1 Tax=Novosphingobium sp. PASSN1 TaxID=2015561 RepID=UPI000BD178D3|nr:efflux RND transporter periplasmic adaptor subunit [Novosphingobium sp. PASSN1]OYU36631.1 MAG: efflux transporter periplasmic adaptor subunit [Novosphingobium sp. PASSN1]